MESAKSISSRESLCSVESTASEEEEEEGEKSPCSDFGVFLSDSESEAEKEARPLLPCHEPRGFLFPPALERTNSRPICCRRRRLARKPLGVLASACRTPAGSCCRYPPVLDETFCPRFLDAQRDPSREDPIQQRTVHRGRKRQSAVLGESQLHKYAAQPPLHGLKKQRTEEGEPHDEPHCWSEGDSLFAQKCLELQGFIRPLRELLHRLKMGRFDRGLSSFQQSVAMDRIQRIIGVLQKPAMGERYLHTLLQVERMLKVWFPRVAIRTSCSGCHVATAEKNPFKMAPPSSTEENPTEAKLGSGQCPASSPSAKGPLCADAARVLSDWPSMNLTWIHTVPVSNPPLGHLDVSQANSAFSEALLGPNAGAYGVVIFLQSDTVSPAPFGRPTSVNPVHTTPCCHSKSPLLGPRELPRCQSLPGSAAVTGGCLPRAGLGYHTQSLPYLPALFKEPEPEKAAPGRPPRCSDS